MKKGKLRRAASLLLSLMLVLTLIPTVGAGTAFADGDEGASFAKSVRLLAEDGGNNSDTGTKLSDATTTWTQSGKGCATFDSAKGELTLSGYNYNPISVTGGDLTLVLSGENKITGAQSTAQLNGILSGTGAVTIKGDGTEDSLEIELTGNENASSQVQGIYARKIVIDGVDVSVEIKNPTQARCALRATEGIEIKNGATLTITLTGGSNEFRECAMYNETGGNITIDKSTVTVNADTAGGEATVYNSNGSIRIQNGSEVTLTGPGKASGTAITANKSGTSAIADQNYNVVVDGTGSKLTIKDYGTGIANTGSYTATSTDADLAYAVELTGGATLDISSCYNGIKEVARGVKVESSILNVAASNTAFSTGSIASLNVSGNSSVELQADDSYALSGSETICANFDLSGGTVTLKAKAATDTLSGKFKCGTGTKLVATTSSTVDPTKVGDTDSGYILADTQPTTWTAEDDGYYTLKFITDKTELTIGGITKEDATYDGTAKTGYTGTATYAPSWSGTLTTTYYLKDGTTKTTTANSGAVGEGQAPKNAGTYKLTLAVPDTDPTYRGSTTVEFTINKANLTADGTATATADYGTQVKDITISGLTAKLGEATVAGAWSFDSEATPDVGTTEAYTASFTPAEGSDNYNPLTKEIIPSINALNYTGETKASGEAKYGTSGTVDLSDYIVEGGTATVDSTDDTESVLADESVSISGTTLNFKFKDDASLADKAATINIKLKSKNYKEYTVEVTVKVLGKSPQTITASDINATYGDTAVTLSPTGAVGEVSYEVTSGKDVISVDESGNLTIKKAGSAVITIKATGDDTYAEATKLVQVSIEKRLITVKANDKTMTVNGTLPTFDVTYGNLAAADTKDTVIETEAVAGVADGVDGKTAGSFDITIKTLATLKSGMADKYDFKTAEKGTLTVNTASGGGAIIAGGGAAPLPTTEKPVITIDNTQGKAELSSDGTTADITANEGYEIEKVTVNGVDKGAVNKLTGLKTGDKVVVTFKSTAPTADGGATLETIKEKVAKLQFMARSSKTSKKNVKLSLKFDSKTSAQLDELKSLGYTVKYKFYRSTKKSSGYKATLTKTSKSYTNTKGVKGTMYYYKARVQVYDKDGKLVAQTALKQCKYASRLWTK